VSALRPRVACFSPLPPDSSGISDYSEELLPHLARHWDLDLFVDGYWPRSDAARGRRVIDCARIDPVPLLSDYDAVLYHVGNSPSHDYVYDTLLHWPGLVVLHELAIHHLVASRTIGGERRDLYVQEMRVQHGDQGAERARRALWGDAPAPWESDPLRYPLNRRVLGQATGVLAHSRFVADAVCAIHPTLLVRQLDHHAVPLPAALAPAAHRAPRSEGPFVFVTAGNLNPTKRVPVILRALTRLQGRLPFRYRLVGEIKPDWGAAEFVEELGLADAVEICGRVDRDELYRQLLDADVCVCLRSPTLGETSGIVLRALACGRPLVVTDAGWFAELPDEIAVKVPADRDEERTLAELLEALARDPERRRRMGEAALEWASARDLASRAEGYDAFVRAGGLFPKRWIGRAFHSVTASLRELDHEYAACAGRLTTTRLLELADWRNPPTPRGRPGPRDPAARRERGRASARRRG